MKVTRDRRKGEDKKEGGVSHALLQRCKFLDPWPGNSHEIICVAGTAKGDHIKRKGNCEGHTSYCRREACTREQGLAERIRAGGKETQY